MKTVITPRLKMIAQLIRPCHTTWDIGTDHAYLPIYLIRQKICQYAYALDLKEGPLVAANRNIQKYGYQDHIATLISDGLEKVTEYECVIIAGMGGGLIAQLLDKDQEKAKKCKQLLLQPMTNQEVVKQFLWDHGYEIINEDLCGEKNKIYHVFDVCYTGKMYSYGLEDLYYSKTLMECKPDLFQRYMKQKIKRLNKQIKGESKKEWIQVKNKLEGLINDGY